MFLFLLRLNIHNNLCYCWISFTRSVDYIPLLFVSFLCEMAFDLLFIIWYVQMLNLHYLLLVKKVYQCRRKCKITRIFNIVLALVFISPGKYMSVYMYPHLIQQEHAQYWISYSNKMHGKTEFTNEEAFNTFVSLYRASHLWK